MKKFTVFHYYRSEENPLSMRCHVDLINAVDKDAAWKEAEKEGPKIEGFVWLNSYVLEGSYAQ